MASFHQDWQSTKNTLRQRNRHMFNNPLMSDVAFTCEDSENKVFAHKYVLATSSTVFYAMFYSDLAEMNPVVHLSDADEESLQEFLRFLYTDECELTLASVVSVLYLAKKYIVPFLAQKCIKFLNDHIATENVFVVLQQAIQFDEDKLEKKCWNLINWNTSEAVASDAFTGISQTILVQLLKREKLKITELDLFKAVLRWSVEECSRKGIEANAKNKRAVLGNAIYEIRFGSMSLEEFAQNIPESGILTLEEMLLFYGKIGGIQGASENWNMSQRGTSEKAQTILKCCRFLSYDATTVAFRRRHHTIGISFSKPVKIYGVRLIGTAGKESDVMLEVGSQKIIHKKFIPRDLVGFFDVLFPVPIKAHANVAVQLKATIIGQNCWFGVNGRSSIETNGIKVHFFDIPTHGNNETTVERGQFDTILFSEC